VSIIVPAALNDPQGAIAWAARELQQALSEYDVTATIGQSENPDITIEIAVGGTGVDNYPQVAEAMALERYGDTITAWGFDSRGVVYALTELADRVRTATGEDLFAGTFPLIEQPTARVRSMARLFCAEEEDKVW